MIPWPMAWQDRKNHRPECSGLHTRRATRRIHASRWQGLQLHCGKNLAKGLLMSNLLCDAVHGEDLLVFAGYEEAAQRL